MATYLERYRKGEHEAVWAELIALGPEVGREPLRADAYAVACETMHRIRINLELLIPRLQAFGYQFGLWSEEEPVQVYSGPLVNPTPATAEGISHIERQLGSLPLSLRAFAEIVGSVDFRGYHPEWAETYWLLDPLVVEVPFADPEWLNYVITEAEQPEEYGEVQPYIEIAPDRYHKDNISGGPPYAITLSEPTADGPIMNLHTQSVFGLAEDSWFILYLRTCLLWGGFPGFAEQSVQAPQEQIDFLTHGLIPF